MIHADADAIRTVIAADPVLLRTLHNFFDMIAGDLDADIGTLLDDLPAQIAQFSPYTDEANLTEVVRREMLAALQALTLRMLPTKGNA